MTRGAVTHAVTVSAGGLREGDIADALRTPGAILRLELRRDAAGWPTLIATTLNDDRPVVSSDALRAARRNVHAARGSILELRAGRTLRLRLPPG